MKLNTGETGEQGPSKDIDIITVSKTIQFGPDSNDREVLVTCPENTKVSGGGLEFTRTQNTIDVIEIKPFNNGWKVSFVISSGVEGSKLATVYA